MALKNVEKTEKSTVVLEISVDGAAFESACEKAYRHNVGKINVQGFRKGKAPRKIIERLYGEGVFYDDALNIIAPEAYDAAVDEAGISPVDKPELDVVSISKEDGVVFKATVTVKPEVTLGQYKGIEAEMPKAEVTDADVDEDIERRRKRAGQIATADREIKNEDTAVIDFEGFIDGVAFEGGKGEKFNLKIGSGQFIPGFEEQLIGKKAGENAEVNVTFPEEYHAKELAGKPALFKVFIHEVKETILPELDDEFAKDISEFETLAELKEDIRKKMLESREKAAQDEFEGRVLDKILEGMEVEIPPVMVENQLDKITEDYAYRLSAQGISLDAYLQMSGMDMESFRKTFREQAERQVKTRLALEAVSKAESFEVTEEDIEAEYAKMAESYKMPADDIKKHLSPHALKQDLVISRAADFVKENAVKTQAE